MRIRVGLSGSLRRHIPEGAGGSPFDFVVEAEPTALEVLMRLGVPPDPSPIVTVDGVQVEPSTVIREGQQVSFFPPLAGGS